MSGDDDSRDGPGHDPRSGDYGGRGAHARLAGQGIQKIQHPNGDTEWRFGHAPKPRDVEALANHTRRMLHQTYREVTRDFYGATPKLATTSPFESNRRAMKERAAGSESETAS